MNLPTPSSRELAAQLGPLADATVVLDFDGTLSPIVDRPEAAVPAPGALEALRAVASRTQVAVLSGRPLGELRDRLPAADVTLIGGHGAHIRTSDGQEHHLVDASTLTAVLDEVETALLELVADGSGWLIERKLASLAVHHRLVPEDEEEELLPRIDAVLDAHGDDPPGFTVLHGKAVRELRPRGVDKGRALRWLLEREPGRTPVVFGDDETDEDAFRVALEVGGKGILVAAEERPTAAGVRLPDPAAVVQVLAAWAEDER